VGVGYVIRGSPPTAVGASTAETAAVVAAWQSRKTVRIYAIAAAIPTVFCLQMFPCATNAPIVALYVAFQLAPIRNARQMPARRTYHLSRFPIVKSAILVAIGFGIAIALAASDFVVKVFRHPSLETYHNRSVGLTATRHSAIACRNIGARARRNATIAAIAAAAWRRRAAVGIVAIAAAIAIIWRRAGKG